MSDGCMPPILSGGMNGRALLGKYRLNNVGVNSYVR